MSLLRFLFALLKTKLEFKTPKIVLIAMNQLFLKLTFKSFIVKNTIVTRAVMKMQEESLSNKF